MNYENIRDAFYFLAEVPPENFNLATWHCGTTACLAGWITQMPGFDYPRASTHEEGVHLYQVSRTRRCNSGGAVAHWFGLVDDQLEPIHPLHRMYNAAIGLTDHLYEGPRAAVPLHVALKRFELFFDLARRMKDV